MVRLLGVHTETQVWDVRKLLFIMKKVRSVFIE